MTQTKRSSSSRSRSTAKKKTANRNTRNNQDIFSDELKNEIILIAIVAVAIAMFLCNFRILGTVGNAISDVMFGLFGFMAYLFPIIVAYICFFIFANRGNPKAIRRSLALSILYLVIAQCLELIHNYPNIYDSYKISSFYEFARDNHKGGGVFGGSLAYIFAKLLGKAGSIIFIVVIIIICLVIITERSFVKGVRVAGESSRNAIKKGSESFGEYSSKMAAERSNRRAEAIKRKEQIREDNRIKKESAENEKILNMKEVSGVPTYNFISEKEVIKERDDIHEINLVDPMNVVEETVESEIVNYNNYEDLNKDSNRVDNYSENYTTSYSGNYPNDDYIEKDNIQEIYYDENTDDDEMFGMDDYIEPIRNIEKVNNIAYTEEIEDEKDIEDADDVDDVEDIVIAPSVKKTNVDSHKAVNDSIWATPGHEPTNGGKTFGTKSGTAAEFAPTTTSARKPKPKKPYVFPPLNLLNKSKNDNSSNKDELIKTSQKLEEVLASFNVKAKVTQYSQGPAVTRYELTPETGVKVSKILSLQDDIKLNLAAADIRIEAPIPGKAAIGIEVPNKNKTMVALRDIIENDEFKNSQSKISFAVGKDIAGKSIVTDIGKMPHVLIAGATGSGKSVCINTLIMSILYKAKPEEVKLIMIDPKVVELSVYNGIPHLLIPVVTDPKKANASLAWAVKEMDDRYKKFAEYSVRDLKGYNEKIKTEVDINGNPIPPMYQLVVIVDELADLMMVAGKEVEESICRLAQLARACGIHLVIATQRPSVDVITGLIKANMPSRIAFAVSSGVDSRTILDMIGAEKLLGNGDMLFYPKGYTKPARVQGAFVSDKEVSDVVEFIKKNNDGSSNGTELEDIQSKIAAMSEGTSSKDSSSKEPVEDDGQDEYYVEAGRLITQSGKCSIGMLQRKFKIGFNRAARIMDALSEDGVVGPDEGTKPRTILMTQEEFEAFINQ